MTGEHVSVPHLNAPYKIPANVGPFIRGAISEGVQAQSHTGNILSRVIPALTQWLFSALLDKQNLSQGEIYIGENKADQTES